MGQLNSMHVDGRARTRTLIHSQDDVLRDVVLKTAHSSGATNVFNPSVMCIGDSVLVTMRGESHVGERPFHSWLVLARRSGEVERVIDLTEAGRNAGIAVVADPKLVRLGDEVYSTFNTGHTLTGPNSVYLQRVFPSVGIPQECQLDDRQRIEKNWAFFLNDYGDLFSLYGIAPVQILALRGGSLGAAGSLQFAHQRTSGAQELSTKYTIGTQLHATPSGGLQLIVHQKHRIAHKRAYTGRLARLSLTGAPTVHLSSTRLIHSYIAALPRLRPHNRRLISATYFSGLTMDEGDLVLSYGVNDRTFGIARVKESQVW